MELIKLFSIKRYSHGITICGWKQGIHYIFDKTSSMTTYRDDMKNGYSRFWLHGILTLEGTFKNDNKHGVIKLYINNTPFSELYHNNYPIKFTNHMVETQGCTCTML